MAATLLVTWEKMGSEFTYDVLYTTHIDGPWIKHNEIRLTDAVLDLLYTSSTFVSYPYASLTNNTYVITGLNNKTKYYVKIKCYDKYYQWWYCYSSHTSIGGGLSNLSTRPSPTYGNVLGFQVNIVI